MTYWITMHWPSPPSNTDPDRHVYVQERHVTLPQIGDIVFLYESKYATVEKKRVKTARRMHRGHRGPEEVLPVGFGGLIGLMTVAEQVRNVTQNDVVYEYGEHNLSKWRIIPCRDFQEARLGHVDLLKVLGMAPKAPPTSFSLRKTTLGQGQTLAARLAGRH